MSENSGVFRDPPDAFAGHHRVPFVTEFHAEALEQVLRECFRLDGQRQREGQHAAAGHEREGHRTPEAEGTLIDYRSISDRLVILIIN